MDRKEKATEILKYYGPKAFESKIFDEDFSMSTEIVGKWIFKTEIRNFNLSDRLINQVIVRNRLNFQDGLIKKYEPARDVEIKTEEQALDVARKINEKNFLRSAIGLFKTVYSSKKDNEVFDEQVKQYVDILNAHVEYENLGDYGVIYCQHCTNITPLSDVEKEFVTTLTKTVESKLYQNKDTNKSNIDDRTL